MASGSLYSSQGPFTSAYQKTSAPTSSSKATLEEGVGSFKFGTLKGLSTESRPSYRSRVRSALGAPGRLRASLLEGLRPGKTFVAESSAPGPAAARRKASPSSALPRLSSGRTSTWPRVLTSCCSWGGSFLTARRLLGPRLAVRVSEGPAVLCHRTQQPDPLRRALRAERSASLLACLMPGEAGTALSCCCR